MNHQIAVDSRATERYLLDELDEGSRSAFEEHYFTCRICAEDVRTAAQFVDNAQAVLRADGWGAAVEAAAPAWAWWRQAWLPAAMAACLLAGYLLPRRAEEAPRGAEVLTALAVPAGPRGESGQANGDGRVASIARDSSHLLLRLDVGDDVQAPKLHWEVRTAAGMAVTAIDGPNQPQVTLLLPAALLPPGGYEVRLRAGGPDGAVVDRYRFSVQRD